MSHTRPPGRPDLLTKERHKEAVKCFKLGDTQGMTANIIGVGLGTLEGWLQRGHEDISCGLDTKYSGFYRDVKKAISEKARKRLERIDNDATWQSSAWILERTLPREFGRNTGELYEMEKQLKELKDFVVKHLGKSLVIQEQGEDENC